MVRSLGGALCLACAAIGVCSIPDGSQAQPRQAAAVLRQDVGRLAKRAPITITLAGFGAAAVIHRWDDDVHGHIDQPVIGDIVDGGRIFGSTNAVTAAALFLAGSRLVGSSRYHQISSELLRSLLLTNGLVAPLKFAVGRRRPDGSNHRSFPSGHSANAFALATTLARHRSSMTAIPIYGLATIVPISRIHHGRHFISDVIAGSSLGIAAGLAVSADQARPLSWAPLWTGETWLLSVSRPL